MTAKTTTKKGCGCAAKKKAPVKIVGLFSGYNEAIIEFHNGDSMEFSNYKEALKAYNQITNSHDFAKSGHKLKLIDLRDE